MFLLFYFFFIVQLGLLMVRITEPWGVFLISTPFLCSLFPALKSPGCFLLFVICRAISRAVLEERGVLVNGHCSCSCKTLVSPRNLGFTENSTRVCEEWVVGAAGGTEHAGLLHGHSWLHWSSGLPPWCVCGGGLVVSILVHAWRPSRSPRAALFTSDDSHDSAK